MNSLAGLLCDRWRRADEMVRLMQITEGEIRQAHKNMSGEIRIGAGESLSFHHLSRTAGIIHREYPDIRFTITSGDTADLMDQPEICHPFSNMTFLIEHI